jgi:hypothetical protein
MAQQEIPVEKLNPESIDPETEANEARKARTVARQKDERGALGAVEDAVTTLTRPLSSDQPSEAEIEEHREANDREQRG